MNNMFVTFIVVLVTINILWGKYNWANDILATKLIFLVTSQERIIGGTMASIRDFPYQLSLHYRGFHECGAVLITKSTALTAAHCVLKPYNTDYTIRAGSRLTNFGGINVKVACIRRHPKFNSTNYDYDIAVLIFNRPIYQYDQIMPIKLPQPNENPRSGQTAVVSGWGSTTNPLQYFKSVILRKVTVIIIDHNVCKRNYSPNTVTDRMICAGSIQGGKDACQVFYLFFQNKSSDF